MKEIAIVILLVLGFQNLKAHGGHLAVFKYQVTPTSIVLEFQIENSVLRHFDLQKECESYKFSTALCVAQYINNKHFLNINDAKVSFELESSRKDKDFFIMKMIAKGDFSNYEKIVVSNKCFLEFDQKFENRVIIQKENAMKSYLLNKKTTTLVID